MWVPLRCACGTGAGSEYWGMTEADLIANIVAIMSQRGLRADYALSDIQDQLTMAGYDVPLRSYQRCDACHALSVAARCPEHTK